MFFLTKIKEQSSPYPGGGVRGFEPITECLSDSKKHNKMDINTFLMRF